MPREIPDRMWLIRWGFGRIDPFERVKGLRLDYCPFLLDHLDWGPQHPDLATQDLLRQAYFRWPGPDDTDFDAYKRALQSGKEVALWCEPLLAKRSDRPQAIWSDYWPCAALAFSVNPRPNGHYLANNRVWERLLELSGLLPPMTQVEPDPRKVLIQAWFDGEATNDRAHFGITHLGRRVRNGTVDYLPRWRCGRWVGGRLVSGERPLRRHRREASELPISS